MVLYLRLWVYGFVWMCLSMCFWLCVCMVMHGYRVSILREARFNKYRGFPLLGARFHHYWDLLLHEAYFSKFWDLLFHEAHFSKFRDSSNFSNFPPSKMEKFAPVCSVE